MKVNTPLSEILEHKGGYVHTIHPEKSVEEAVEKMNREKVGSLLVMNGDRLVGVFTERDVLTRVVVPRLDAAKTPVHKVMTSNIITVKPEQTVEGAMRIITQKRCRHLPVMDGDRLVGMVSIGDLMRWLVRENESYIENLLEYINGQYPG